MVANSELSQRVLSGLDDISGWQEELYTWLHQNPELSMQETGTRAEITKRLTQMGYDVHEVGGGVVGVLANGQGPTVLFRADIDALPVAEATGLPYASTATASTLDGETVPVMHACGHDMHVTAALGAASLLASNRDAWEGTYVALFQPGEETAEGARAMVDAGLGDVIPHPDVALAQHVLTSPSAGKVATASGPVLSTGTCLKAVVYGKGSHGSMPHLGVDPALLASYIVVRLQSLVARELAPGQFGVVTVGSLQVGTKANIIADSATLLLNIRAYDEAVRDQLVDGIKRIVRAECEASRSPREPEFALYDSYPLTSNDDAATQAVTDAFVDYFGADRVTHMDPITASEDFSIVPDALGTPYTYWGLGGFIEGQTVLPNHNPGFAPSMQPTLRTGTEAAVVAAMAYFQKRA